MTQHCCASTIYHAYHAGLQVDYLVDASGSLAFDSTAGRVSAEEIHRALSVVFQTGFAAVTTTQAWIAALADGGPLLRDNPYSSHQRTTRRPTT